VTFIRATSKAKPTAAAYHAGPTDAIILIRRAYLGAGLQVICFAMVEPGFTPDRIDAVLPSLRVAVLGNAWRLPE
jgi:hypothetical protein